MSNTKLATTVLDAIEAALAQSVCYNRDDMAAPAAILWPDKERQWEPLTGKLCDRLPHFLTLGPYDADARTGPAIWLRCMLAKKLPEATWGDGITPILYLPGVSRQDLRQIADCPEWLQPLVELQFRGVLWTQTNGRDWTVFAFLQSADGGLGLDVARDNATLEALQRALSRLADEPVDALRNRRLEAEEFHALLTPDPVRDLLAWMNDPPGTRARWDEATWESFRGVCKQKFKFDPHRDGELSAGESLGLRSGPWAGVWRRFEEAPTVFPRLKDLLRRAKPKDDNLFAAGSPAWPQDNEAQEDKLRTELSGLRKLSPSAARQRATELEREHGVRRGWIWAQLGCAPLASAMEHLAVLANLAAKPLVGASPQAVADAYAGGAWRADAAVVDALSIARADKDAAAVHAAVRAMYEPWLHDAAVHFQQVSRQSPVNAPRGGVGEARPPPQGCCVLFVDALRFDCGQRLQTELRQAGFDVVAAVIWSAMPSVTPTAKPAISPIADLIDARSRGADFRPTIASSAKDLTPERFMDLLESGGIAVLQGMDTGDPSGTAWTECGRLDSLGHKEGWRLAWRVAEEIAAVVQRIAALFEAGWREVRVVTDHGWLLMPGGLPKQDMPRYLTETRWGRCAELQATATPDVDTVPWHWNPEVRIAVAPGAACFKAGLEYAHGGLTVQECLVPLLTVRPAASRGPQVTVKSIVWKRLVCKVTLEGNLVGCRVDIRSKASDETTSLLDQQEPRIGPDGVATLYADDAHEGAAGFVVVLGPDGNVISRMPTIVGGE